MHFTFRLWPTNTKLPHRVIQFNLHCCLVEVRQNRILKVTQLNSQDVIDEALFGSQLLLSGLLMFQNSALK